MGSVSPSGTRRWFLLAPPVLAFGLLIAGPAALAAPSPVVACPLQAGATFLSIDGLDARIVAELKRRFSAPETMRIADMIAPRDAEWQVTDVVTPGQPLLGRRFIQGGRVGTRWYVWYESGGIAHQYHAALFDLAPAASAPRLLAHISGSLDQLCPVTRAQMIEHGTEAPPPDRGFW
jgi:hypothetical protein